jgi:hypothetical protein
MDFQLNESYEPITSEKINNLENKTDINIPLNYKEFLLKNNGGYPKKRGFLYRVQTNGRRAVVNKFLGIHDGENNNLYKYLITYKIREKRLPSNLIPIANDPGGNLICLSINGEDVGKVYFWDHDLEAEEGQEPDYSNVYFIADCIEDFLKDLRNFDE